jgi:soluble lytic murein transglycosylase
MAMRASSRRRRRVRLRPDIIYEMTRTRCLTLFAVLGLVALGAGRTSAQGSVGTASPAVVVLRPTDHPPLPDDPSQFWMTPTPANTTRTAALNAFASAVKLEVDGQFAKALLPLSQPLLREHPLGEYVQYYKGLAQLSVGRTTDARSTFQALVASGPAGYLWEAAAFREAESDEALGDHGAALAIYERLSKTKTSAPDDLLIRMGMAAEAAGDPEKALEAFSRAYYEFPFSDLAPAAELALDRLPNRSPIAAGTNRFKLELGRAEQLFGGRRYSQARTAFARLQSAAQGDDVELVNLRIAESDYFLKQLRAARDGVKPYIEKASRQGEALFFYAAALYDLGNRDEYFRIVRRIADDFPTQTWSEEALNHLATHFIVDDEDAKADETFREMYARFPGGRYAERAAWKIGWLAYRNQQYSDTIRVFEGAAARFPRSDYRPPWLYWSARSHEALQEADAAQSRYLLAATDYFNSYYGRLALTHLNEATRRRIIARTPLSKDAPPLSSGPDDAEDEDMPSRPLPPNEKLVRALLGLGLYDQAINELQYAQRVWGESPAIRATLAWIYQKQGQSEKGSRQFNLYRASINTMKRAYPQYLAVSGERLPKDVLRLIFPLQYWDLIRKYSALHELDPYFVAALMAQESTFVADIQSPAKAVGLMQLEAKTARQYAKKMKMRYTASLRSNPDANVKIGTAYLADKIREFGDLHFVLAAYNAGEGRVRKWRADRPGLPRDEFIDDIPFPETQNYVKRILGTAEDYRRIYGGESGN